MCPRKGCQAEFSSKGSQEQVAKQGYVQGSDVNRCWSRFPGIAPRNKILGALFHEQVPNQGSKERVSENRFPGKVFKSSFPRIGCQEQVSKQGFWGTDSEASFAPTGVQKSLQATCPEDVFGQGDFKAR